MRVPLHHTINDGKNKPVNRYMLRRTNAKLFCPECKKVSAVVEFFAGLGKARLECQHTRSIEPTEEA
jgi:hypothetical protein